MLTLLVKFLIWSNDDEALHYKPIRVAKIQNCSNISRW